MRLVWFNTLWQLEKERDRGVNDYIMRFSSKIPGVFLFRGVFENHEDEDKKKLISKIMTKGVESSSLRFEIKLVKDTGAVGVSLQPDDPSSSSQNILKSLERRFHGKVKISAFLSQRSSPDKIISLQGMRIDSTTFACAGTTTNKMVPFPLDPTGRDFHVQLVANFPFNVPTEHTSPPYAQKVLEDAEFSDIKITAGNGVNIKAHKSFLSVCSPVLQAMLRSDMEESKTGRVNMSDMSEEGVRAFLRYVYHDDLQGLRENFQVAFELLCASHKYAVSRLETEMKTIFLETSDENFNVAVAFKTYMFTRNIESAVELKTKVLQVLKGKWDELELVQEYNDFFEKPSNFIIAREVFRDLAKIA